MLLYHIVFRHIGGMRAKAIYHPVLVFELFAPDKFNYGFTAPENNHNSYQWQDQGQPVGAATYAG